MVATDLVSLAIDASKHAYVPYSHFPIGAALKTKDGTIYTGCNIENASFGLTNCGERTAIFKAVSDGHKELAEIAIYGETQEPVSPCGACRQVMAEFFEPSSLVTLIAKNGQTLEMTVGDLLPYSFTDLS
ncbi:UNVERIFIED_CONTAM: cytidine deaminase [Streptococcus canis]|uniref:Cytidine deaminase n=2 Tax=Streptococcus canis TaxID=1329 RepID=A0AAE4TRJ8_STRCB|nr:cytidine deaminase [Streptococcus canis]EIQ81870.1 cytidine deaminase [Streptococcus canis FSL Z3-227]MDV5975977.1 cytidine deaminase [Streptococcus canis]MDV5988579.1 cytidine deaminase [Streptococcus canis]MDV5993297.1 cytidine deaminase [Streptococcus canis]MDV6001449.1 cytidine deaminase [Streptococcus canis]